VVLLAKGAGDEKSCANVYNRHDIQQGKCIIRQAFGRELHALFAKSMSLTVKDVERIEHIAEASSSTEHEMPVSDHCRASSTSATNYSPARKMATWNHGHPLMPGTSDCARSRCRDGTNMRSYQAMRGRPYTPVYVGHE